MQKIQWDDSLSVGVDAIDEQHKRWIEHYNSVVGAILSHGGTAPVVTTLSFLLDYTDYHFTTEEGYMTEAGYPRLGEHKGKHAELREAVSHLVEDFEEEGPTPALEDAVETLLGRWLVAHIKAVDQRFGAYCVQRDIDVTA